MGAALGGVLMSRLNPWMMMSVSLGLTGLLEMVKPLCTNLVQLGVAMTVGSCFGILFDAGTYRTTEVRNVPQDHCQCSRI